MKKHYAFIPLKDKDLSSFRKSLLASISPRPVFAVLALVAMGFIGYFKQSLLLEDEVNLFVFALAVSVILYIFIMELQKLFAVARIHKSSLIPYIHVRGLDSSFYIEEVPSGFIIQIAPVSPSDISDSKDILSDISANHSECRRLSAYLLSCMDSHDILLVNKAVIYVEIISDQLKKGNKDILATYDKLLNYKED